MNGEEAYDLVFNLTPSKSAASFCSLIAHDECQGMWLGEDGSFQAADPWAAYLVAMMANRRTNPFHLVDIWLRTLGQRGPRKLQMFLSAEDVRGAEALLTECGVDLDTGSPGRLSGVGKPEGEVLERKRIRSAGTGLAPGPERPGLALRGCGRGSSLPDGSAPRFRVP